MKTDPSTNEAYRQLFDIIRPRSESPTWMTVVFVGFIALLVVLLWRGRITMRRREEKFIHRTFKLLSAEKGLAEDEEELLWRMARGEGLIDPLLIYSSISAFDKGVERELGSMGEDDPAREELAGSLEALRRKLRFDKPPLGWSLRHTREIPVGQRIRVGVKRDGDTRFCTCTVVEVDDRGIAVTSIVRSDQDLLLGAAADETLYVRFWRRDDTEYKFRSHALERSDPDLDVVHLAHTDDLERVQRRDFFRLPAHLPVSVFAVPDADAACLAPAELRVRGLERLPHKAMLVNLSAGGAAVRADATLEQEQYVMMDPEVRTSFSLEGIAGQVVRSESVQDGGYIHHVEFTNVSEVLRDRLVGQIDREQIKMARRERGLSGPAPEEG